MLVTTECIPCYLQQAINTLEKGEVPQEKRAALLKELLPMIKELPDDKSPAENSTVVIRKLVELIGGNDPFEKAKRDSNNKALEYVDYLNGLISQADDRIFTALKISVAGNVVDMGLFDNFDLSSAIEDSMKFNFAINDYKGFREALEGARRVLIVGDNSGEIVFDKLLVKELLKLGKQVVYGVKGGFILNDATLQDAKEAGLPELVRVVDNGNTYLGTIEEHCSPEFIREMKGAHLIISKGQANYESLEGTKLAGGNTYFLLKAKCPVVAGHLGVKYGDIVFAKNEITNK